MDPTGAAVKTGAVDDGGVGDHGGVIGVVNNRGIHVGDGTVITKDAASPGSTHKANPGIAEPVIDAAVEAYVRTPVSAVPSVKPVAPTPIAGGPKQSDSRWLHPRT